MRQFALVLAAVGVCGLAAPAPASAQMFTDFKPGGYVPKDGYTPDPSKVMYVLFWHHKKRTNAFDHRAYYRNADGVNDTTARKMKELMEQRYPNLTVYVKETNERDIKALIEREQKRVKFIEKDWGDVKQPEKVAPPKKVGDRKYSYEEDAPKELAEPPAKLTQEHLIGRWEWRSGEYFKIVDFEAGGTGKIQKNFDVTSFTITSWEISKDGDGVTVYQKSDSGPLAFSSYWPYKDGKLDRDFTKAKQSK